MKRVVSAEEMRAYEQARFFDGRADSLNWMERAAQGVDELLRMRYPQKSILCICGAGCSQSLFRSWAGAGPLWTPCACLPRCIGRASRRGALSGTAYAMK